MQFRFAVNCGTLSMFVCMYSIKKLVPVLYSKFSREIHFMKMDRLLGHSIPCAYSIYPDPNCICFPTILSLPGIYRDSPTDYLLDEKFNKTFDA